MSLSLLLLTLDVVSVCYAFQTSTVMGASESPRVAEDFHGKDSWRPQDDPNFFISKWTPQAELLQDPAVKAVITHCGWGGTLESWLALLAPNLFFFPFHCLPL